MPISEADKPKKIFLYGKSGKDKFALVDEGDFKHLNQWKWYVEPKYHYAVRPNYLGKINGKYKNTLVKMHREIMDCPKGMVVDHINGDRRDNRRSNLRIATNQQNSCNLKIRKDNTSKFKGVSWHKGDKKWRAKIGIKHIGNFNTQFEAAIAYNAKAIELFGEFAQLNKI